MLVKAFDKGLGASWRRFEYYHCFFSSSELTLIFEVLNDFSKLLLVEEAYLVDGLVVTQVNPALFFVGGKGEFLNFHAATHARDTFFYSVFTCDELIDLLNRERVADFVRPVKTFKVEVQVPREAFDIFDCSSSRFS